jgi:hypothetical protein
MVLHDWSLGFVLFSIHPEMRRDGYGFIIVGFSADYGCGFLMLVIPK